MKAVFNTRGVCASKIEIDVEDGVINSVNFIGGCDGNLSGMAKLLVGMRADEAAKKLEGIKCGRKDTSCPDQLAKALEALREAEARQQ